MMLELDRRFPEFPSTEFQHLLASAVSTQWYEQVFDAISESVFVVSRSGRIQSANRATFDMLGYRQAELYALEYNSIVDVDSTFVWSWLSHRHARNIKSEPLEITYKTKSGERLPVLFSSSSLRDEAGTLRAIVCVARDIRMQKLTASALEKSEERLRIAIEATGLGIWDWDIETDKLYASVEVAKILSLQGHITCLEDFILLVHPEERDQVRAAFMSVRQRPTTLALELRIRGRCETYRWLRLRGRSRANDSGAVSQVIGSLFDFTEAKISEQLRGRFIEGIISAEEGHRRRLARELHDETGQSLTSLLVHLKALEQNCPSEEFKQQLSQLRTLTRATVDEVGRLAWGLHPRVLVDLGFVIALERYTASFEKTHGIEIDLHCSGFEQAPRLNEMTEITLYRILQEALTNVAKHAEAKTVSVIVQLEATLLHAIVEDDGCGFDVGQRGVDRDNHSGLGLQGMKERAALFDGDLTIESRLGSGTTLFIQIPLTHCTAGLRLTP